MPQHLKVNDIKAQPKVNVIRYSQTIIKYVTFPTRTAFASQYCTWLQFAKLCLYMRLFLKNIL